jgi:hypothetical protein
VKCFGCKPANEPTNDKPVDEDTFHALMFRRVGSLGTIALTGEGRGAGAEWMCVCARCGKFCVKDTETLLRSQQSGHSSLNCGCTHHRRTHGKCHTREYRIWQGVKQRCTNPKNPAYKKCKERGGICDRWRESFQNFWDDMGPCPEGWSLDRIDNEGQYNKANCRWAPIKVQNRNKGNNRRVQYNDELLVLVDFADEIGMSRQKVGRMLDKGCTPEEIAGCAPYYEPQHIVTEYQAEDVLI